MSLEDPEDEKEDEELEDELGEEVDPRPLLAALADPQEDVAARSAARAAPSARMHPPQQSERVTQRNPLTGPLDVAIRR